VKSSTIRREILRLQGLVGEQAQKKTEARRAFAAGLPAEDDSALDREIARFLVALNKAATASALMRSQGVLLLFYFSLHKLLRSHTLLALLKGLIPRKTNQKGRKVRDRQRQIRTLVEQDPEYRARYLKTMRTLHFVAMKQLDMICRTFSLDKLLLRDAAGRMDGRAYLKLLAAFLHETLYSGLSVIVGFEYRSAAAAFQDGAERLLASMGKEEV
jgi:hypothetical protein